MEMFLKQQVPANSTDLRFVYEHFRSNLRDIISVARDSGAHVLISTVGVNLRDSAPFASLHRPDLKSKEKEVWENHIRDAAELGKIGRFGESLERYLSAAAIDDRHAELQYRIGHTYWELGQFAAAAERLSLARDLDALRFRADSSINEIIRSVASGAGAGVELLDAEDLFAEASPHKVPGNELFYEHAHLTARGNYLLARALFPRVVALLPEQFRGFANTPHSQEEAEGLLALTNFDRRRVALTVMAWLSQPPFPARLNNNAEIMALSTKAKISSQPADTAAAYRWAIAKAPDDPWLQFNYGIFLETHDQVGAVTAFRRALELLPNNYSARQRLADALVARGNYHEAIAECRELLGRMPYHAPAYMTMAFAQGQLGLFDESIAAYKQATKLHSMYAVDANINIGLLQIHQGKFDWALDSFRKAIAADSAKTRTAEVRQKLSYA
jgi:tetratricopeptide (TPR) repeat protein